MKRASQKSKIERLEQKTFRFNIGRTTWFTGHGDKGCLWLQATKFGKEVGNRHIRHFAVNDDHIDHCLILLTGQERLTSGGEVENLKIELDKKTTQGVSNETLVIRKQVPTPSSVSNSSSQPCWLAVPQTMASPIPVPSFWGLVVKNGSKILSRMASGIPVPRSRTSSTTRPNSSSRV